MRVFGVMALAVVLGCGGAGKGEGRDAAAPDAALSEAAAQDNAQATPDGRHGDLAPPPPDGSQAVDGRAPGPPDAPPSPPPAPDARAVPDGPPPDARAPAPVDGRRVTAPACPPLTDQLGTCGHRGGDTWIWMYKDGYHCAMNCVAPTATAGGRMPVSGCATGKGADEVLCVSSCTQCSFVP